MSLQLQQFVKMQKFQLNSIFRRLNLFGEQSIVQKSISSTFSTYKSDLSLENLYKESDAKKKFGPEIFPSITSTKFTGYIPIDELQITYSRSSGPGGQNVNCVSTKVDVRFEVDKANWLTDQIKERIRTVHRNRITNDGFFIVKSDTTRSRHLNLADALERLRGIIRSLDVEKLPPTPETQELIRKRMETAARKRIWLKRQRSSTKADRNL